jgi:hypothetical protein
MRRSSAFRSRNLGTIHYLPRSNDRRPTSPVKALRGLLSELLGFVEVLLDDRQRFSGKGLYRVVRPYRHISRIASRRLHGR